MGENRKVIQNGQEINYILTRKKVKNINIRIMTDGSIEVSANENVPIVVIEDFIKSKAESILKDLDKISNTKILEPFEDSKEKREKAMELFRSILDEIYPIFAKVEIKYPVVKVRTMKTKWGSCAINKNQITLNTRLIEQDRRFVEYVILHEMCHFIHPDHSKAFYNLVQDLMPDWKDRVKTLTNEEI